MSLLDDEAREHLKHHLTDLKDPVTLKFFSQEMECMFCREARELIEEIGKATDKVKIETFDFIKDKETVSWYGIDKIPAVVVEGKEDPRIRFFGIPAGYELGTLLEDIRMVSHGVHNLKPETVEVLNKLPKPVHIQVFVTLTCPYCPKAVHIAHQMAMASPNVRADMIESAEFPQFAQKYGVMTVPKIVINEKTEFTGALPEKVFLKFVEAAAGRSDAESKPS